MRHHRVLVVEDDAAIREGLVDALESERYAALEAADGDDGMASALGADYDLLLLDLILPGTDGFDILRAVRQKRPGIPVIILTARGEEGDRVRGLRMGADDYVVKPFSVKEVLARVEAVLRRVPEAPDEESVPIGFPGGHVNPSSGVVHFDARRAGRKSGDGASEEIALSERELALLRYLVTNAGRVVSREEILVRVWGINAHGIETRTIDMHVARLRSKLGDSHAGGHVIRTVRGKGYVFGKAEE